MRNVPDVISVEKIQFKRAPSHCVDLHFVWTIIISDIKMFLTEMKRIFCSLKWALMIDNPLRTDGKQLENCFLSGAPSWESWSSDVAGCRIGGLSHKTNVVNVVPPLLLTWSHIHSFRCQIKMFCRYLVN